jgi:hypothetical protein
VTRGGKRLFPRLLVLRNLIRKEVLKVPRSQEQETVPLLREVSATYKGATTCTID